MVNTDNIKKNDASMDASYTKKERKKCLLCLSNDHIQTDCPQIVCAECDMYGHEKIECREVVAKKLRSLICTKCPNKHSAIDYSLFWQIYEFNRHSRKKARAQRCCCLEMGHFIANCDVFRVKNSNFTNYYEQIVYHKH